MTTVLNHTSASAPRRTHARAGFTLFEIAISLALALVGVVSVAMLMPAGIKAEQLSRLRIYAGVKAEEIVEEFANSSTTSPCIETEAIDMWEVPAGYRVLAPDLEARVSAPRFGIMPLPDVIARRLVSDDGELEAILAQGGKLYYAQAQQTSGLSDDIQYGSKMVPNDNRTQQLVFAVTGYAQNNNLANLAWKDWPYYEPYPSPPGHGEKKQNQAGYDEHAPTGKVTFPYGGTQISLWEGVGGGGSDSGPVSAPITDPMNGHGGSIDPDISTVFTVGYKPYDLDAANANTQAGATTYLQSALWYCQKKGLPVSVYRPGPGYFNVDVALADAMKRFNDNFPGNPSSLQEGQRWMWVQALRFLAHSSACMTRWQDLAHLGGQPSTGTGFAVAAATIGSSGLGTDQSPDIVLTHDLIVYWHELSMRMVMAYRASQPYDWGAPRPTQAAIMMDYPLIECDLMSSTLSGTISGSSPLRTAQQWRPLPAHPITNPGRSYSYPDTPIDPTGTRFSSAAANFTLARPFTAAERCRQLVFWTADWQSYEDAETAPSAAIDASKYLFAAPIDLPGGPVAFETRMQSCAWPDHHVYQFRNPEKNINFTSSIVATEPTGADVTRYRMPNDDGSLAGRDRYDGTPESSARFLGQYGADRNFNGILDRGTIPPSVHLRVTLAARYNFYDPRLTLKLK